MITGAAQMDGARFLVVNAADAVPQTREHILAGQAGRRAVDGCLPETAFDQSMMPQLWKWSRWKCASS